MKNNKTKIKVKILFKSESVLTVKIMKPCCKPMIISGIYYGSSWSSKLKKRSEKHIQDTISRYTSYENFIIGGDFNHLKPNNLDLIDGYLTFGTGEANTCSRGENFSIDKIWIKLNPLLNYNIFYLAYPLYLLCIYF